MELYRELGVCEYWLVDPLGEYLQPPLQGFRLVSGEWEAIPVLDGRGASAVIGLELVRVPRGVQFYDPAGKQPVLSPDEQAEAERERADAARADHARLLARIADLEQRLRDRSG